MRIITKIAGFLAGASLLVAVPLSAADYKVYEVNVLRDDGSQYANIESGNYQAAIDTLEERLKFKTNYRDVKLTNLCTAYVLKRDIELATDACDKAVEANGEFVTTAFNSRGVLNALKGDFVAAAADFEMARKTHEYSMWTQLAHRDAIETNYRIANHNMMALRAAEKDHLTAGITR